MRIFKTQIFNRWAAKINLSDNSLRRAIEELEQGQFEANLGGYLYKKRIAAGNKGKSGGLRTIVAFRKADKAFFVYGFAKNNKANMTDTEETVYKDLATLLFSYNEQQILHAIKQKQFIEIL